MQTLLALVAVLATACLDAPLPPDELDVASEPGALERGTASYDAAFCEQLPDFGLCSFACTPEKLVAMYVPRGTCAVFECQLADGTTFPIGGCND